MPQSLAFALVHIIFSTKDRAPVLDAMVRPALHAYLVTVARSADCECYRVGGVADHVHLAIHSPALAAFSWQRGYGVFSVGPCDLNVLRHYIDHQEEHHKTKSFQDEYRAFLTKI